MSARLFGLLTIIALAWSDVAAANEVILGRGVTLGAGFDDLAGEVKPAICADFTNVPIAEPETRYFISYRTGEEVRRSEYQSTASARLGLGAYRIAGSSSRQDAEFIVTLHPIHRNCRGGGSLVAKRHPAEFGPIRVRAKV